MRRFPHWIRWIFPIVSPRKSIVTYQYRNVSCDYICFYGEPKWFWYKRAYIIGRAQNCCIQKKCIEYYIENFPFMAIFLHNLYIFVWIKHDCFANMVFALDLSNSVMMLLFFLSFSLFFFSVIHWILINWTNNVYYRAEFSDNEPALAKLLIYSMRVKFQKTTF